MKPMCLKNFPHLQFRSLDQLNQLNFNMQKIVKEGYLKKSIGKQIKNIHFVHPTYYNFGLVLRTELEQNNQ